MNEIQKAVDATEEVAQSVTASEIEMDEVEQSSEPIEVKANADNSEEIAHLSERK
jgi:DNA-binding protein